MRKLKKKKKYKFKFKNNYIVAIVYCCLQFISWLDNIKKICCELIWFKIIWLIILWLLNVLLIKYK